MAHRPRRRPEIRRQACPDAGSPLPGAQTVLAGWGIHRMDNETDPAWLRHAGDLQELMGRLHDVMDAAAWRLGTESSRLEPEAVLESLAQTVAECSARTRCKPAVARLAMQRAMHEAATGPWDAFLADFLPPLGDQGLVQMADAWTSSERRAFVESERCSAMLTLGHPARRLAALELKSGLLGVERSLSDRLGLRRPGLQARTADLEDRRSRLERQLSYAAADVEVLASTANFAAFTLRWNERFGGDVELVDNLGVAMTAYRHGHEYNPALLAEQTVRAQDWLVGKFGPAVSHVRPR